MHLPGSFFSGILQGFMGCFRAVIGFCRCVKMVYKVC